MSDETRGTDRLEFLKSSVELEALLLSLVCHLEVGCLILQELKELFLEACSSKVAGERLLARGCTAAMLALANPTRYACVLPAKISFSLHALAVRRCPVRSLLLIQM